MNYVEILRQAKEYTDRQNKADKVAREAQQLNANVLLNEKGEIATPEEITQDLQNRQQQFANQPIQQSAPTDPNKLNVAYADRNGNLFRESSAMGDPKDRERMYNQLKEITSNGFGTKAFTDEQARTIAYDMDEGQQQALSNFILQGATPAEAIEAVTTGQSKHEAGILDNLKGLVSTAVLSTVKAGVDLTALSPRLFKGVYGTEGMPKSAENANVPAPLKPFIGVGGLHRVLDEWSKKYAAEEQINRGRALDQVFTYNKETGEMSVVNNTGWLGNGVVNCGGVAPFVVESLIATPIGAAALAGGQTTSSDLLDNDSKDLWDTSLSISKGIVNGGLMLTTHKVGNAVSELGKVVAPTVTKPVGNLIGKFGASATQKMLANRVGIMLANQAGGLTSAELFMVGDAAYGSSVDKYGRGKDIDIKEVIENAAHEGISLHFLMAGGKALLNARSSIQSGFKIGRDIKGYNETIDLYSRYLKENFAYEGGNKLRVGKYEGKSCFVLERAKEGKVKIAVKEGDSTEVKEVEVSSVSKTEDRDIKNYAGDEILKYTTPEIPYATKNKDGKWVWYYEHTSKVIGGETKENFDGQGFFVLDKDGKRKFRIYNADEGDMQTPQEYIHTKQINGRVPVEEAKIEAEAPQNPAEVTAEVPTSFGINDVLADTDAQFVDTDGNFTRSYVESMDADVLLPTNYERFFDNSGRADIPVYRITNSGLKKDRMVVDETVIDDIESGKFKISAVDLEKDLTPADKSSLEQPSNATQEEENVEKVEPTNEGDNSGVEEETPNDIPQKDNVVSVGTDYRVDLSRIDTATLPAENVAWSIIEQEGMLDNTGKIDIAIRALRKQQSDLEKMDMFRESAYLEDVKKSLEAVKEQSKSELELEKQKQKDAVEAERQQRQAEKEAQQLQRQNELNNQAANVADSAMRKNNKEAKQLASANSLAEEQLRQTKLATQQAKAETEQVKANTALVKEQEKLAKAEERLRKLREKGNTSPTDVLLNELKEAENGNETDMTHSLLANEQLERNESGEVADAKTTAEPKPTDSVEEVSIEPSEEVDNLTRQYYDRIVEAENVDRDVPWSSVVADAEKTLEEYESKRDACVTEADRQTFDAIKSEMEQIVSKYRSYAEEEKKDVKKVKSKIDKLNKAIDDYAKEWGEEEPNHRDKDASLDAESRIEEIKYNEETNTLTYYENGKLVTETVSPSDLLDKDSILSYLEKGMKEKKRRDSLDSETIDKEDNEGTGDEVEPETPAITAEENNVSLDGTFLEDYAKADENGVPYNDKISKMHEKLVEAWKIEDLNERNKKLGDIWVKDIKKFNPQRSERNRYNALTEMYRKAKSDLQEAIKAKEERKDLSQDPELSATEVKKVNDIEAQWKHDLAELNDRLNKLSLKTDKGKATLKGIKDKYEAKGMAEAVAEREAFASNKERIYQDLGLEKPKADGDNYVDLSSNAKMSIDNFKKVRPEADSSLYRRLAGWILGRETKKLKKEEVQPVVDAVIKNYDGDLADAIWRTCENGDRIPKDKVQEFGKNLGKEEEGKKAWARKEAQEHENQRQITAKRKAEANVDNKVSRRITAKEVEDFKNSVKSSGLFSKVQVVSDIVSRYEKEAGKEAAQALRDSNDKLLGFVTKDGRIFLSEDNLNADTYVHEMAHPLLEALDKKGLITDKWWAEATVLAKSCGALDELPSVYQKMDMKSQVEEALARAIGKQGGINLKGSMYDRFTRFAQEKWNELLSYFGVSSATDKLKWNDLARTYAEKLTNGGLTNEEVKAVQENMQFAEDSMRGAKEMADNEVRMDVEMTDTDKGPWSKQWRVENSSGHLLRILDLQGLGNGKETFRQAFCRYVFDSLDAADRILTDFVRDGAYVSGAQDFVEASAASMASMHSQAEKLNRTLINDVHTICNGMKGLRLKVKDRYGVEREIDDDIINDVLVARNAESGRNERQYKENIAEEENRVVGVERKKVKAAAQEALTRIKDANKKLNDFDKLINDLSDKINAETDPQKRKTLEDNAVKTISTFVERNRLYFDKVRVIANNMRTYHSSIDKKNFEDDPLNQGKTYVRPANLTHIESFGFDGVKNMKFADIKNFATTLRAKVSGISAEVEYEKIEGKIEARRKKFYEDVEKDKTRIPQSEFILQWGEAHPNSLKMGSDMQADLAAAIKAGQVQKYRTDGCGITTDRARQVIKDFTDVVPAEMYDELVNSVEKLTQFTLDITHKGRIMSDEEYADYTARNKKEHYVPLRDFKYDPLDNESDYMHSLLRDGSASGREIVIRAKGRASEAGNVIGNISNMAINAIYSSRTNLDLIQQVNFFTDCINKTGKQVNYKGNAENYVTVGRWYKLDADGKWQPVKDFPVEELRLEGGNYKDNDGNEYMWKGGNLKQFASANNINAKKARAHTVGCYIDGRRVSMIFAQERVAAAYNQTHRKMAELGDNFAKDLARRITAFQSRWMTTYDPRFMLANHQRDVTTYAMRLAGSGYSGVGESLASCYKDLAQLIFLKEDVNIEVNGVKYNLESLLNEHGLATGYVQVGKYNGTDSIALSREVNKLRHQKGRRYKRDENNKFTNEIDYTVMENVGNKLDETFKQLEGKTPQQLKDAIMTAVDAFSAMVEKGEVVPETVAKVSEILELVPRLAAFKVALKNGADFEQARNFGKSITVNFNKSGDLKNTFVGSWWFATTPFVNAHLQGVKMAYDMTQQQTPRVFKQLLAMFLIGVAVNEIERELYGQTSYGKSKIATVDDYNRGSSFRIPLWKAVTGEDEYVQWNMPHFYKMPLDASMQFGDWLHGDRTSSQLRYGLAGSLGDISIWDFSRLGEDKGTVRIATQMSPSLLRISADLAMNKSFFGTNIYGESFDEDSDVSPAWQKTIGHSTSPILIEGSKMLNEFGGGNDDVAAGYSYTDSEGIFKPNEDSEYDKVYDINPQGLQYLLVNYLPVLRYFENGHKGLEKAERNGEEGLEKALSVVGYTFQTNKIFKRGFPEDNVTAKTLVYSSKKKLATMRAQMKQFGVTATRGTKEYNRQMAEGRAKYPAQWEEFDKWDNIGAMMSSCNTLRKDILKAQQAANNTGNKEYVKKADELSEQYEIQVVKLAEYLYRMKTEVDLHDNQKVIKDWLESLEGKETDRPPIDSKDISQSVNEVKKLDKKAKILEKHSK